VSSKEYPSSNDADEVTSQPVGFTTAFPRGPAARASQYVPGVSGPSCPRMNSFPLNGTRSPLEPNDRPAPPPCGKPP
jgi:hypothetical protein